MPQKLTYDRRRFLSTAVKTMAVTELTMSGFINNRNNKTKYVEISGIRKNRPSFDTIKHIDAGVLNIGYAEEGKCPERI